MKASVVLTAFLASVIRAGQITCPTIQCAEQDKDKPGLKADLCYKHDQQQPNKYVQVYQCDWYQFWGLSKLMGNEVACELDILNGEFAWVEETNQDAGTTGLADTVVENSQINKKRTEAYCLAISSYKVMLNNGRTCTDPWQCKSMNCHNGVCKGLSTGETCFQHSDCDAQLFCALQTPWPWEYKCQKLRTSYE